MIKDKLSVLVVSFDGYSDLWPLFFDAFFKAWKNCTLKIYLGANSKKYDHPLVTNLSSVSDIDYSTNLLTYLESIETKYVLLTIEDFFYTQLDQNKIILALHEMEKKDAKYLKLIFTYPFARKTGADLIVQSEKNSKYIVGVACAIWDTEFLKHFLISGESAWDIEKIGSKRASKFAESFYVLNYENKNAPRVKYRHAVVGGKWFLEILPFLNKHYPEIVKNRKRQTILAYLKIRTYRIVTWSMAYLRLKW